MTMTYDLSRIRVGPVHYWPPPVPWWSVPLSLCPHDPNPGSMTINERGIR